MLESNQIGEIKQKMRLSSLINLVIVIFY